MQETAWLLCAVYSLSPEWTMDVRYVTYFARLDCPWYLDCLILYTRQRYDDTARVWHRGVLCPWVVRVVAHRAWLGCAIIDMTRGQQQGTCICMYVSTVFRSWLVRYNSFCWLLNCFFMVSSVVSESAKQILDWSNKEESHRHTHS